MKFEIIDNFLPKEEFEDIKQFVLGGNFDWYWNDNIVKGGNEHELYYLGHILYHNNFPTGQMIQKFLPIIERLNPKSLIRAKINNYPYHHKLIEHGMHVDYDYDHLGAVFSFNTCDGYTKFYNGTIIPSVENRIVLFNSGKEHTSTNTTNAKRRVNMNINYF